VVGDREIVDVVRSARDLASACDSLVARANAAGGPDNISCVLFHVAGDALPAPERV
jgi:serine/threonine protein phosphatase PrpC